MAMRIIHNNCILKRSATWTFYPPVTIKKIVNRIAGIKREQQMNGSKTNNKIDYETIILRV